MLRQSIILLDTPIILSAKDKKKCTWISVYVIIQCILVFIGALTIHLCVWSPDHSTRDYDKLARIMYLYDPSACGYNLQTLSALVNVRLSNNTHGLNVLPIKWIPADITVTTRLSAKARRHIHISIFFHVIWLIAAIALVIFKSVKNSRLLKSILTVFFYVTIFFIIFDLSMAIVYIAHIQQSLTKEMIMRYSGWSVEMKITDPDAFGGWWPIAATIFWMRGIIFFCINVYCCRVINLIRRKLQKSEVRNRLQLKENMPIPEPDFRQPIDKNVLYFKKGESKPLV